MKDKGTNFINIVRRDYRERVWMIPKKKKASISKTENQQQWFLEILK